MKTGQILGGNFFFINNNNSKKIIKKILELSMNKNLVDDTSSKSKELKTFIEHRNDQSIISGKIQCFTILCNCC